MSRNLRHLASLLILLIACGCRSAMERKTEALQRGDAAIEKKQYGQAVAAYRAAVQLDQADGHARIKLAGALSNVGNGTQAAAEAARAAELLPADVDVQLKAADLLLGAARYPDAADRASAVLKINPNNATALVAWGNAKARLLNSTWALYSLPDTIRDKYKYDAALADFRPPTQASDDATAEAAFRKALEIEPSNDTKLALVNFLWAVGRPDEGEALLRSVADDIPGHAAVNHAMGGYYLSRHKDAEAERYLKNAAATGEYGQRARFVLADYYIDAHRTQDALTILKMMEPADDASGEVSLRVATIEFQTGHQDEAMRRVDAVLARKRSARALLVKAQFSLTVKSMDQALQFAREAVADAPSSTEARLTLGRALLATGDLEDAYEQLVAAIRLSPRSEEIGHDLAEVSLALGRGDEALPYARDEARRNPTDSRAGIAFVKALVMTGNIAAADTAIGPLASRTPNSPDVLTQLGTIRAARGNDDAARAAFTRALQLDGNAREALAGLVSLDLKEQHIAAARQRVEAAVASHPRDAGYLLLSASVYIAGREGSRAESALRQVLEIDPADVKAAMTLADYLMDQHRPDEAKRLLEQTIQHRPRSIEAQTALGELLEATGHVTEARAAYERVVAESSRAAVASSRLAALYAAQGENLDRALTLAVAAKQLLPNDPAVTDVVGWVYTRKNLPQLAIPLLQNAVRAAPRNGIYRYHLGSAYLRAGQAAQARDEFTRALQADGNSAYAGEIRQALASMPK